MLELLNYRKLLIIVSGVVLILLTWYMSFVLRLDHGFNQMERHAFAITLPVVLAIKLVLFYNFGLLRGWWRYVGMNDLLDIAKAAVSSAAIMTAAIVYGMRPQQFPRSVIPIDFVLTIVVIGGARFAVRAYTEMVETGTGQKTTLIVGAGQGGNSLVRELKNNPSLGYHPIGIIDDDSSKRGLKLHGVRVLGGTERMAEIIAREKVSDVLIAMPSATGKKIERVISQCRDCKVDFKILPKVSERIHGAPLMSRLRALQVEDLLGRESVRVDLENIRKHISGRVALITGAGGSIGSELARQLASFGPSRLVCFERSENDLFRLSLELSARFPQVDCAYMVGDILDVNRLREAFALFRPNFVLHAAAYKHVPMMEKNCFQAVTNNIFGTYNVALVAGQFRAENFVMISSDKAVRPTNVMGATKRAAELIILALQCQHTRYTAVRFGNVLGSNGSVVPIFQQQIANGGPVTVTHPDATRYFMSIPEAVQLVLQASIMGRGGEIFVLDMGEPIRIADVARNLIRLSGLEPDTDIQIVFTGLRPGEKLHEELVLQGEGMGTTEHEKIRVLHSPPPEFARVQAWLKDLSVLVARNNTHALIDKLTEIVPEYRPGDDIQHVCDIDRYDQTLVYSLARASLSLSMEEAA